MVNLSKPHTSYFVLHTSRRRGFTLVEALVYTAVLAIVAGIVVEILVGMTRASARVQLARRINHSAQISLERLTREIRNAQSVNGASSIFNTHPGRLSLTTLNALGLPTTIEFSLTSTTLQVTEGSSVSNLTPKNVDVTNLVFRPFNSTNSQGIKVELELSAAQGRATRTEMFYTGAVLRGSY